MVVSNINTAAALVGNARRKDGRKPIPKQKKNGQNHVGFLGGEVFFFFGMSTYHDRIHVNQPCDKYVS
jgi:hypothetical protein